MNPSNSESSGDVREISLDLPLFMMDKVIEEVADGRAELTGSQRRKAESVRAGARTGITRDFGKMVIDGVSEGVGTTPGIEIEHAAVDSAHADAAEGEKPAKTMPPDVAELLVRVLSSPEFESLLDQPVQTMLWTPETAGSVSDQLAGACLSFRLAEPAVAAERAEKPPVSPSEVALERKESAEQSSASTPAFKEPPLNPERQAQEQATVGEDRSQHAFLQDLGSIDQAAWTKRLEMRLLLERPGQLERGTEREDADDKQIWAARPRIRRTLERPAFLPDIAEQDKGEKEAWAKRPKLRGTLERPAVLEDLIQKEAGADQAWAKRPKLRQTLERPANLDEILRDARAMFIANLTAASKYYGRHDEAGGDSAVDKAIFELVRPGGVTESGVAIAPIILATLDGILFEYGKSSGATTNGAERTGESVDSASERRQVSMNLAQIAQMNILAANAADASARLVAETGRALVKVEEMSNLTSNISQMVKDAISNRASSIQHATIEAMARAAAKENCAESLVTLIKQNVRESIEVESRQTLKQTIKTMSVKSAQDQRTGGTRPAGDRMPVASKRDKGKEDGPVAAGGGGAAAERAETTRARESAEENLESFEKYKAAARPEAETAAVAVTPAETMPRPKSKKVESAEAEPVTKQHGSLEVGGPGASAARFLLVPQDAPGAMTVTMIGRSGQDLSRLGELLVAALSRKPLLARLIAACGSLRSESRPAAESTVFDISLDGLGSGETLLIVLAKDKDEALKLQAHVAQELSVESGAPVKVDESEHRCEGAATLPIAALVEPQAVAAAAPESSAGDNEQQAPADREQGRDSSSVQGDQPRSAWDACKQALGRLFGRGSS